MKIEIPPNFKQMVAECVDPTQSCDYMKLGEKTFRIEVLPIGLEKKIVRIPSRIENYTAQVITASSEIARFHFHDLDLDWIPRNLAFDEAERFYLAHLEKLSFNDEIEKLADQIQDQIEWKPVDEKQREESKRYTPSYLFLPVFSYLNAIEGMPIQDLFNKVTRGFLAIVKLSNMISSDQMRHVDLEKNKEKSLSQKMNGAGTLEEYMTGLSEQGVSINDLF